MTNVMEVQRYIIWIHIIKPVSRFKMWKQQLQKCLFGSSNWVQLLLSTLSCRLWGKNIIWLCLDLNKLISWMGNAALLLLHVIWVMVTVTKMRTVLVIWSVAQTTAGNIIQMLDQHCKLYVVICFFLLTNSYCNLLLLQIIHTPYTH